MFRSLIALLVVAGCGSDDRPATSPGATVEVTLTADPAGRTAVARVNGTPIYDDCVARQAAANQIDLGAALDQCIDFELLAQAAERAGLSQHPRVLEVRQRETARRMVLEGFANQFDGPEDVPEAHLRDAYQSMRKPRFFRDKEWRRVQYARAERHKSMPPGWVNDWHRYFWIQRVYHQLEGETFPDAKSFLARAREVAGDGIKLKSEQQPFEFTEFGPIERLFRAAAFEITEVGGIHEPIPTKGGWDIIYLERIRPPIDVPFEEAAEELRDEIFEVSRARSFTAWLAEHTANDPEIDEAWLERLAAYDQARAALLAPRGSQP